MTNAAVLEHYAFDHANAPTEEHALVSSPCFLRDSRLRDRILTWNETHGRSTLVSVARKRRLGRGPVAWMTYGQDGLRDFVYEQKFPSN